MADTLTAWLRSRDPAQLATVLSRRSEAIAPPLPRNLAELAERLTIPASVANTLRSLPAPALHVVEVLQVLGPGGGDRSTVASWLGSEPDDPGLSRILAELAELALVWPDQAGSQLRMAGPLYGAFRFPLGLGPSAASLLGRRSTEQLRQVARRVGAPAGGKRGDLATGIEALLRDPEWVRKQVAQAETGAHTRLQRLAQHGPAQAEAAPRLFGDVGADPALDWAAERGLVLPDSWGTPVLPREVALALRGPGWHVPFLPDQPVPPLTELAQASVANEAAAAAAEAVAQLGALLSSLEATPVSLLKAGGVGAKELRRLARTTGADEPVVRFWLEVAYETGLVATVPHRAGGGELLLTADYDAWAALQPAQQLAAVLPVWEQLPVAPLLAATGNGSRPGAALQRDHTGQYAVRVRRLLLSVVGALPAGRRIVDPEHLVEPVRWHCPLLLAQLPEAAHLVATAWQEATLVGVVAHGACSVLGTALLGGDAAELVSACQQLLPDASEEAVFQADLTVLVPGAPAPALAALLDAAADRESRGSAVTWRFTPGSVRRALDHGHQPDQLLEALRERCTGRSLPQPLEYLITDTGRRHGAIRVREAGCLLRVPDEALAAELVAARALRLLGLVRLAPTVLSAAKPIAEVLASLRDAGYAPVAESADGVAQLAPRAVRRAEPRWARRGSEPVAPPAAPDPLVLAEQLLSAPDDRERRTAADDLASAADLEPPSGLEYPDEPGFPSGAELDHDPSDEGAGHDRVEVTALGRYASHLSAGERRLLAHAVATGAPVTISYMNAQGNPSTRVIEAAELEGRHLYAWCRLREDERVFALHRVESVEPAP